MNIKIIISILLVVVALFLIFGLYKAIGLKQIKIKQTVKISSSLKDVFNMVVFLENFPKWSPFLEIDPTQEISITGVDGSVGAQYHWEGNKGKDLGYQEIVKIDKEQYIKLNCNIKKPFKSRPVFEYTFKQQANFVEVIQDFSLESGLVDAFFMWLFGVKKEMIKINARGMELLKIACEEKSH